MTRRVRSALFAAALLAVACSPTHGPANGPTASASTQGAPPRVYASIGGAETRGEGTDNPLREAWPQDLFRTLPANYTLINVALPGATVAEASADELPLAESLHPNLVTIWLNVADILDGTSPERYRTDLRVLVHRIRATGATVLVANTPRLDRLPAYLSCQDPVAHPGPCPPFLRRPLPAPDAAQAAVEAYNSAVAQIALTEGATMVDLTKATLGVSDNGFDLSAAGQQYVADQFAAALARSHSV